MNLILIINRYKKLILFLIIIVFAALFVPHIVYKVIFSTPKEYKDDLLETAREYLYKGHPEKAAESYEKLIRLRPDYSEPLIELAVVYDDYLDKNERSVHLYKRYLEMNPQGKHIENVEKWMKQAARESIDKENKEEKVSEYTKLKKNIHLLEKENQTLKKQVEVLTTKLYNIEQKHEKQMELLKSDRDRLSSELSSARIRIGKLLEELESLERSRAELQKKIDTSWTSPTVGNEK